MKLNINEFSSLLQEDEEITTALYEWWWDTYGANIEALEASEY